MLENGVFADVDAARLGKLTKEFGAKGYATLDEMLKDPALEARAPGPAWRT